MITKNKLITSITFNGINTIMLLYYLYDIYLHPVDLEHITRWSYYLNSVFTTICFLCDIFFYYSLLYEDNVNSKGNYILMEDNKNEERSKFFQKLNDWNRNSFGVICNSLSYFILIGFWSLYFFGNSIMLVSKNVRSWFNSFYHHLIIQIIVIIDVFVFRRRKINFSWKQFGILFSLYTFYCGIICFEKYFIGRDAYYFMEGKSFLVLNFCFFFSLVFLFISYLIHIYLIEFSLKMATNNEEEENSLLCNKCNKIFHSLNDDKCMNCM